MQTLKTSLFFLVILGIILGASYLTSPNLSEWVGKNLGWALIGIFVCGFISALAGIFVNSDNFSGGGRLQNGHPRCSHDHKSCGGEHEYQDKK